MNLASMFIDLSVKGGSSALTTLGAISKGLGAITVVANQASQLIGTVSNLARTNAELGNSYLNLNKEISISSDRIQRWEIAARKSGAQASDVSSSFIGLRDSLMKIGESGSSGYLATFLSQVNEIDKTFDRSRFFSGADLDYTMNIIRKLAREGTMNVGHLRKALAELGISDAMGSFMMRSDIDLSQIDSALIKSNSQLKNLESMQGFFVEMDATMSNAFASIAEIFSDKSFLNSIKELVTSLAELIKSLAVVVKESGVINGVVSGVKTANKLVNNPAGMLTSAIDRMEKILGLTTPMNSRDFEYGNVNINQNITNNIQTQDDARSIGNSIGTSTSNANNDLKTVFDSMKTGTK